MAGIIKNVYTQSLTDVFVDSSLSTFTDYAIMKGVTDDSIIYIKCDANDSAFGEQFVPGSKWIWAKGELVAGYASPITMEDIHIMLDTL